MAGSPSPKDMPNKPKPVKRPYELMPHLTNRPLKDNDALLELRKKLR